MLFVAVEIGNERLIRAILDHGTTIDILCKDHWTPLHEAADTGKLEIVKYLVSRGVSTSKTFGRGLTALHRAPGRGHLDVMPISAEWCKSTVSPVINGRRCIE